MVEGYMDVIALNQAGFAHAAAALIFEDLDRAVLGGPAEEDVRNQLLEAGVFFHAAAGQVLDLVAFEKARQILRDFGREALEVAEAVEEGRGDDEDAFGGDGGHGESFREGAGAGIEEREQTSERRDLTGRRQAAYHRRRWRAGGPVRRCCRVDQSRF